MCYCVRLSIFFLHREKSDDPRKHPFFKTINFPRLEAGLVEPPYVPDPSVVYAKDIDDIEDFSEVRGIEFDDRDQEFFQRFATGAVPIAWQEEIIETGLFAELNPTDLQVVGRVIHPSLLCVCYYKLFSLPDRQQESQLT